MLNKHTPKSVVLFYRQLTAMLKTQRNLLKGVHNCRISQQTSDERILVSTLLWSLFPRWSSFK